MGNTHQAQKSRLEADALQPEHWIPVEKVSEWGYGKERGPETWWMYFPAASGNLQSPINISPEEAEFSPEAVATYPLKVEYPASEGTKIVWNTGYTLQVEVRSKNRSYYVTGGPFKNTRYELRQVHFHWGERDEAGSEHTVKGVSFAMEVHFVHWNADQFSCYEDAAREEGGLVVVSVFANLDSRCNPAIEYICNHAQNVTYKRQWEKISVDIKQLLPNNTKKYWVYNGSMTFPPCYESVTWVIFNDTITVSPRQLSMLRTLHNHCPNDRPPADECQGYITKNCRNLQPTGTRRVTAVEHVFTISQIVEYASLYDGSSIFTSYKDFTWTGGLQGAEGTDY